MLKSGIVYKLTCPRCVACFVGQTSRHMQTRFREHTKTQGPMRYHLQQCNTTLTDDNVDILASTSRGEGYNVIDFRGAVDSGAGTVNQHQGRIQEQDTINQVVVSTC